MTDSRSLPAIAWLLIVLTFAGCSSWQATPLREPTPGAPGVARAVDSLPKHIRVHLIDGATIEMEHAHVDGDSLRGERPKGSAPEVMNRQLVVATARVQYLEARKVSGGKSAGLGLGILAVGGLVFLGVLVIVFAGMED